MVLPPPEKSVTASTGVTLGALLRTKGRCSASSPTSPVSNLTAFPVAHKVVLEWASKNMDYLNPIIALFEKHKRISHRAATSATEFLDFDEWPSAEAYASFKAEAGPHIEKFESAFGYASTDEVFEMVE